MGSSSWPCRANGVDAVAACSLVPVVMFQPAAPRVVVPLVLIRNAELSRLVPVVLLQIAARNLCQWSCYCYSFWVGGRSCQQQRFVVPMVLLKFAAELT